MDEIGSSARRRFLFRSEEGVIDASTWRLHTGWLVLLVSVMTVVWLVLRPYAHHDLATSAFIAPMTILAFGYLIVFTFAILFVAIAYTMLSIKRLRDRGEPTMLAGLIPFLALCSGSLHFIQPQVPDVISSWYLVALDAVLAIVIVWTIVDLGFGARRRGV
jgi:uncharacterized membrane protein YhaH (DUF805 family)